MAKRIATVVVATLVLLTALLGVASAQSTNTGIVRLDCEHGVYGCAGMNGDFTPPDGGPMTDFEVQVVDATTGAVLNVTNTGCRVTTSETKPNVVKVHCMIDGSELGIDGDIVWVVTVNGDEVWRSAPTPVRCETEDTTTTTVVTTEEPTTTVPEETPPRTPTDTSVPETTETTLPETTDTTDTTAPEETTTTVVELVSPVGPSTPPAEPVVQVPPTGPRAPVTAQETLPETGLTLGEFATLGAVLLGMGVALEGMARRRTRGAAGS